MRFLIRSFLRLPKNDFATALSQQLPRRLILGGFVRDQGHGTRRAGTWFAGRPPARFRCLSLVVSVWCGLLACNRHVREPHDKDAVPASDGGRSAGWHVSNVGAVA